MARITTYDKLRGCYVIEPDNNQNHIQRLGELEDRDEAKEVTYQYDGYADGNPVCDVAACPNCDGEFDAGDLTWGADFCPTCGQHLKWGD